MGCTSADMKGRSGMLLAHHHPYPMLVHSRHVYLFVYSHTVCSTTCLDYSYDYCTHKIVECAKQYITCTQVLAHKFILFWIGRNCTGITITPRPQCPQHSLHDGIHTTNVTAHK